MKKRRFEVGHRVQDRDQRTGTIEAIVGSAISVRWDDDGTVDEMKKADLTRVVAAPGETTESDEADESTAS